jgi:hypothetical protein
MVRFGPFFLRGGCRVDRVLRPGRRILRSFPAAPSPDGARRSTNRRIRILEHRRPHFRLLPGGAAACPERPEILNPSDDHLRETLRLAFGPRPTLRLAEAAKVLNMNEKLLRSFAERNIVPSRITGGGRRRVRREFTLCDLMTFYSRTSTGWPTGCAPERAQTRARSRPLPPETGGFLARAARRRQGVEQATKRRNHDGK